ncbi:MAG: bifunctional DNA-formamidopyrimidine glycosylase/DNA-(apurinic or apyrimidinic site) lyase [Parcubacteria group bacterium]|jgi:formamidopyrimidine-DNA glycosylase
MPELPEVETVVMDLNQKIKGDVITDFWSEWPKAIKGKMLKEFQKEIKGRKIVGARRIGKNIFIDLSGGKTLYIHLKMTGHLLVKTQSRPPKARLFDPRQETQLKPSFSSAHDYFADKVNQYIRHKFFLGKNKVMEFSDVRKFAKIVLDDTQKIAELKEIKKLGVDALSPEFTFKKFGEILEKQKHKPIGIILMDQEKIAGIGNIYRSEILYEAGVLPQRQAGSLNAAEKKLIYKYIQKVLEKAIKLRGTSESDYRDTSGAPGGFQKVMKIYKKTGKKCPKCDTMVERSTLAQRSVFFCPGCQK